MTAEFHDTRCATWVSSGLMFVCVSGIARRRSAFEGAVLWLPWGNIEKCVGQRGASDGFRGHAC